MSENSEVDAGGMELNLWLDRIGRDRTTGHRWHELNMIETCNILGRLYITTAEIKRFWERAKAGEFAKASSGICAKPGPKTQNQA
jgi:hypothetical protein